MGLESTFELSNSNITIDGGSTTIDIISDNLMYTHDISARLGRGTRISIATLAAGTTSYTWKPTAAQLTEFFQEVPTQKTCQIKVYLVTISGSAMVGRPFIRVLTVSLSEETGKPDISGFVVADSNSITNDFGVIVYGKSNLTATATSSGKYGATISRNVFTCTTGEKTYESYSINDLIAMLPLTTTPTDFAIGYKSIDSRGFSNTITINKTIVGYQAPHIDKFEVIRCDESGNESDNGTKAKVVINGSWTAMKIGTTYKNSATLKVGYKAKTDADYIYQTISVSDGIVNISQLLNATLDVNTGYEFSIQLTDSFETYSETGVVCSNIKNILYVSADGEQIVIGSDTGNNVSIDSDSVDIRGGSKTLASFSKNQISLGADSTYSGIAKIHMLNDGLQIETDKSIDVDGNTEYRSSIRVEKTGSVGRNSNAGIRYILLPDRGAAGGNGRSSIEIGATVVDSPDGAAHETAGINIGVDVSRPVGSKTFMSLGADKVDINGLAVSDWVVDAGTATAGGATWWYQKYASGYVTLWGWKAMSYAMTKKSGVGFYYGPDLRLDYPFAVYDAIININAAQATGIYGWNLKTHDDNGFYYVIWKSTSGTMKMTTYAQVMGRWK